MHYNLSLKSLFSSKTNNIINLLVLTSLFFCKGLFALPSIDSVATGDVTTFQANNTLNISQASDKAIINWNNFDIARHEHVQFIQPANCICLNRINSANGMSKISGNLSATGKIILINEAGILFSDTAHVNVGGIIASSINISDEHFQNYRPLNFNEQSNGTGSIINRGVINVSENGLIALLGGSVVNDGVIITKASHILLKSGSAFTVDFYGNGVINFEVDLATPAPSVKASVDENGNPLPNGVDVSGKIFNDGGDVIIMASAAPGIFDNLINMSGEIRAKSTSKTEHGVILVGDDYGTAKVTGTIDVSASGTGYILDNLGGTIVITSNQVVIDDMAVLSASGSGPGTGGEIGLGNCAGVSQGYRFISLMKKFKNPYNKTTYVGPQVKLVANGGVIRDKSGRGGSIHIRSNEETTFLGTATAISGSKWPYGGGGGHIEIASNGIVWFDEKNANVNVGPPNAGGGILIANHL